MTIELLYFGSYWEARIVGNYDGITWNLLGFNLPSLLRQLKTIYGIETNILTFNKN